MKLSSLATSFSVLLGASFCACVVYDKPKPQTGGAGTATATPTAATGAPTATTPTTGGTATTQPTTVATGSPSGTGMPPMPTGIPTSVPPGIPALPGLCIPIGSWTKQFDNGIPATGTVDIGTPVVLNQFPVSDGVVIATAPVGTLHGVGAMTSTNDLSVDVTNGGYVLSYTCKFTGSDCGTGTCTTTKGGLGGFKLVKK